MPIEYLAGSNRAILDAIQVSSRGPAAALLRLGTRGSPLALAQAQEVRARLAAAHGVDGSDRARGDPHHRRHDPGPHLGAGRRQGPVHQGDRGGAGDRSNRPCGAFRQGHADRAAGRACPRGVLPREDARDVFISRAATLAELPPARWSGPRRCAARRSCCGCGRISKSFPSAAMWRPACASSTRAWSMPRCWRSPASSVWA